MAMWAGKVLSKWRFFPCFPGSWPSGNEPHVGDVYSFDFGLLELCEKMGRIPLQKAEENLEPSADVLTRGLICSDGVREGKVDAEVDAAQMAGGRVGFSMSSDRSFVVSLTGAHYTERLKIDDAVVRQRTTALCAVNPAPFLEAAERSRRWADCIPFLRCQPVFAVVTAVVSAKKISKHDGAANSYATEAHLEGGHSIVRGKAGAAVSAKSKDKAISTYGDNQVVGYNALFLRLQRPGFMDPWSKPLTLQSRTETVTAVASHFTALSLRDNSQAAVIPLRLKLAKPRDDPPTAAPHSDGHSATVSAVSSEPLPTASADDAPPTGLALAPELVELSAQDVRWAVEWLHRRWEAPDELDETVATAAARPGLSVPLYNDDKHRRAQRRALLHTGALHDYLAKKELQALVSAAVTYKPEAPQGPHVVLLFTNDRSKLLKQLQQVGEYAGLEKVEFEIRDTRSTSSLPPSSHHRPAMTPKLHEHLRPAYDWAVEALLPNHSNITMIATGYGWHLVEGVSEWDTEPRLLVYVASKGRVPLHEAVLPKKVCNTLVRVLEGVCVPTMLSSPAPKPWPGRAAVLNPLHASASFGLVGERTVGTIGAFVQADEEKERFALTSGHVVAPGGCYFHRPTLAAGVGPPIVQQPASSDEPDDGSGAAVDGGLQVGALAHHLTSVPGAQCTSVDAGLCSLSGRRGDEAPTLPDPTLAEEGAIDMQRPVDLSQLMQPWSRVVKSGRSTGVTGGELLHPIASTRVASHLGDFRWENAARFHCECPRPQPEDADAAEITLFHQLVVDGMDAPFSSAGDSGAMCYVVDHGPHPAADGDAAAAVGPILRPLGILQQLLVGSNKSVASPIAAVMNIMHAYLPTARLM